MKNWEPGKTLWVMALEAVNDALEYYGGNKTKAAKALGISSRTIRNYIAENSLLKKWAAPEWVVERMEHARKTRDQYVREKPWRDE